MICNYNKAEMVCGCIQTMLESSFLNALFDIQYEGLYNGVENRAKTTMAAFDDALHGCELCINRRAFHYSMLPLFRRSVEHLRKTAANRRFE